MPRKARIESGTGIFHVMMRGINHQNIFEITDKTKTRKTLFNSISLFKLSQHFKLYVL